MALAGTLGYLVGSIVGWGIGGAGGRPFVERHGRLLHLGPERLERAERWFDRYDRWAVLLGRITPVVRSFVSIPAGVFRMPFWPYHVADDRSARPSGLRARRRSAGRSAATTSVSTTRSTSRFVAGAALLALYLVFRWFSRLRSRA